jgi:hypothetical protein
MNINMNILAQTFWEQLGDAQLDAAVADAKRRDLAALESAGFLLLLSLQSAL